MEFGSRLNFQDRIIAVSRELQSEVHLKRKKVTEVMKRLFFVPWKIIFLILKVNILVLVYIFNSPLAFLQI